MLYDNYSPSDYHEPPEHELEALASQMMAAIERHYEPQAGVNLLTAFYNVTDLIRWLRETDKNVTEGRAVHAIRRLRELRLLVPVREAVREPDRYGLPHLPEPWLSAALNGRMLDAVAKHGPPDAESAFDLERLENAESEAYLTTPALREFWRSAEPAEAGEPTPKPTGKAKLTKEQKSRERLVKIFAFLAEHPEAGETEIADELGIARETLWRWFKANPKYAEMVKGYRTSEVRDKKLR